jgi:hypothetical protein
MKKKNELPAMIRVKYPNGDIKLIARVQLPMEPPTLMRIELREHSWKAHYTVRLGDETCGFHEYHVYLKAGILLAAQYKTIVDMVRWHHEHLGIKIPELYDVVRVFGVQSDHVFDLPRIYGHRRKQSYLMLTGFNKKLQQAA